MLKLNKQTDYALIVISQLLDKKDFTSLSDLIQKTHLPRRFLARIGATLVNKKILISKEGRIGGYKLGPQASLISLYDFFGIFEKHISFIECTQSKNKCKYLSVCTHKKPISDKLNRIIIFQLQKIKLLDILN